MGISKRFASEEYVTESVTAVEERVTTLETETSELQATIDDIQQNGAGTTVTGGSVKTILANIMTIIRSADIVFTTDISALANRTDALISSLGTTEEEMQPESGIVQEGSVLAITSGVTATQTGSVLAIA